MSEPQRPGPEDLARQARQHLESLQRAGVEWLPLAPPDAPDPHHATEESAAPAVQSSLFETGEPESPAARPAPQGQGLSPEQRRQALELVAEQVSTCSRCPELVSTRTQTVFGVGPLDAELCFIGEAPGADEDAQGEPFVGPAGQLLNKIIAAMGMKREDVYICNVLRCRPPGNRTPLPTEASNCREYLERTLELVRPKFICALGASAVQNLLQTTAPLGKLRRKFHDYRGIPVLCTYHPAYLLPHRNPEKKRDVWEDMKLLLARMGRPIPTK